MGPLSGVKIVELAGIGPGPFCCMLLADMGAEVIRVDRAANVGKDGDTAKWNLLTRGRRNVAVDLKKPEGRSEEHTSELQSLMRISYAVFCLKKKKHNKKHTAQQHTQNRTHHQNNNITNTQN